MTANDAATPDQHAAENRRAVEALAEKLYEANNSDGVAWVKRPRIVRDPWLARARQQLSDTDKAAHPGDSPDDTLSTERDIR